MTNHDELLDKVQARQMLGGIGNTKLHSLLNSGQISAVKLGKLTRFRRSELTRFMSTLQPYKPEQGEV